MPRTSSERMMTTSSPAKATAATMAELRPESSAARYARGVTPSPAATDAATTAAVIDPTLIVLLPIIGVIATILGGLLGAWIQGRREHRKWLRERRFDAYTVVDTALTRIEILLRRASSEPDRAAEYRRAADEITLHELPDVLSRLNLVGPDSVITAKNEYRSAVAEGDEDALNVTSTAFIQAMRKALGISF